jgi:outer membrane lipoprotein SlyB
VYQSVPPPQGAAIKTLPAERVLVTVSGTTYYVNANAFYRRVMNGAQETFVVVTPPAGVVFVQALPADFEVVQLNTMYFSAKGQYYVPYLSTDGKELYVMVDRPPTPPPAATTGSAATATAPVPKASAPPTVPAAAPVQVIAESFVVREGTLVVVRLAAEVSSATAHVEDRVQGFVDQDLAADGRLVAPRGARVYGVVSAVDSGSKMKGQSSVAVTLTDMKVGDRIMSIKTKPVTAAGGKGTGAKKVVGGAVIGATIGAIAGGGEGAAIGAAVGAGAGGVATAASSVAPAVITAQSPQAFALAAPLQVEIMTNVAVR